MNGLKFNFLSIILCVCVISVLCSNLKAPTVVISILARNKAHTLPYFLTLLGKLNYPKDRIALWIRSDHNIDQTVQILNKWVKFEKSQYHMVDFQYDIDEAGFSDEINVNHWSNTRYYHVMNLRQTALDVARKVWADYIWMLDTDVFLTDPNVLLHLVSKNVTIVAPMLKSVSKYSNFWCGMTENYYYQRTEDYEPILDRKKVGCFEVPMVHSSILVDLRKTESDRLTYRPEEVAEYNGPHDDVIVFAASAMVNGIAMNICNDRQYGFIMVPLGEDYSDLTFDFEQLSGLKIEVRNTNIY
ncbi:glycosyltransferase 25 family member [Agrilus planipennis]|uniref:Glycosyltransferase 25 family member n=1 Tax=Agrilus planipennis TaxID=224129 RepID=A0A1W4X4J1_AGRPL|nr:glycosyltransferase 25 family member [Agrilus planipennis]